MKKYSPTLALLYVRNGKKTVFPVLSIEQAITIANAIAGSDCLNDEVDFNIFDVFHYENGKLTEIWESADGDSFDEYWSERDV